MRINKSRDHYLAPGIYYFCPGSTYLRTYVALTQLDYPVTGNSDIPIGNHKRAIVPTVDNAIRPYNQVR